MHAVLFYSHCWQLQHCFCIIGVETNFIQCLWPDGTKLYTLFRTDREEKNHPLSRGTSPYRPYKEVLPGGELRGSVLEISWARKLIGEFFRVSQIEWKRLSISFVQGLYRYRFDYFCWPSRWPVVLFSSGLSRKPAWWSGQGDWSCQDATSKTSRPLKKVQTWSITSSDLHWARKKENVLLSFWGESKSKWFVLLIIFLYMHCFVFRTWTDWIDIKDMFFNLPSRFYFFV